MDDTRFWSSLINFLLVGKYFFGTGRNYVTFVDRTCKIRYHIYIYVWTCISTVSLDMIQGMGGLWGSLGVHCPVGELWLRAGSGIGRIHGVYQPRRLFFLNVCIHICHVYT